jgi:UPF0042 nucleotide-binding protein
MELILISGMSGSGKSVALRSLEDAGYFCVDNLPPEMLIAFTDLLMQRQYELAAVAIDVRSAESLSQVPYYLEKIKASGIAVECIFLDASTETLVHRFSETRRRHPLAPAASGQPHADFNLVLTDAIELDRQLLSGIREIAHVIDTSLMRSAQLQANIKQIIQAPSSSITLVFESFAYKRGVPLDADFVFDVRMLPNPHYEPSLKALTGLNAPVIDYLKAQDKVLQMKAQIQHFLESWLDAMAQDHRSYVTVAIGCTGGQHRSVYLVEALAEHFAPQWITLTRHRESTFWPTQSLN